MDGIYPKLGLSRSLCVPTPPREAARPPSGFFPGRTRRVAVLGLLVLIGLVPYPAVAGDPCAVLHPLRPPDPAFSGRCPNCGMARSMWARTWKSFEIAAGHFEVCSFHCLADMTRKSGEAPRNPKTALYLDPAQLLPVEDCVFVIGSRSPGTMTATSKLAFASDSAARNYIRTCGGRAAAFPATLAEARKTLQREKPLIARKRHRSGKIVAPVDHQDECPVCNMYPARFPANRCQIQTADRTIYHFCSTRCLFSFLSDPAKSGGHAPAPALIWVSDYLHGGWISARTAYYVVGSNQWGPMGAEAFAFDLKSDAKDFQRQHGGDIRTYPQMGPAEIDAQTAAGKE